MDKRKLIQIIEKELEELKILSEEVAKNENDTSLIIELALSKARLLCQEIELLRELTAKQVAIPTDDLPEEFEEEQVDKDEGYDVSILDPELEIVDSEESDAAKEPDEEDEIDSENSDESETEFDDDEDESANDDLTEDEDDQDEKDSVYVEEEIEEEGLIEFGVDSNDDSEDDEDEKPQQKSIIEPNELKAEPQAGVREITIEDIDDEDLEPVKASAASGVVDRPVMREIPKPEELVQEEPIVGEYLQKERSLNDTIGETKSTEPPLTIGTITSLRAAIGLNDRFLFIREIFANNTDKYNTVIDHLDKLETIQQAVDYLKANLTLQKNDTSLKFVDLLKRRFSK